MLALGYINAQVRLNGKKKARMIWPKVAILLVVGFACLLTHAYYDENNSNKMSDFLSIFFFWTLGPYFTGIGLVAWTKRELWP
jgi:heme/copper-type cytochrome/quinol oxidase subunit 3